jgi:peroxiredoxin
VASDNIFVPTLLVRGELSDIVTQEGVDELLARISDITVANVEGAAHMIAGDRNDQFTSAVIDFLDERVRPTLRDTDGF